MASMKERLAPSAISVLCLMIFWGQIQNYMMRLNLSILIVAMVKPGNGSAVTDATNESCVSSSGPSKAEVGLDDFSDSSEQFEWDEFTRGIVLSAFSYGYVTTQIVGGRLAERYGIKRIYGFRLE
jgi:MFS family permease